MIIFLRTGLNGLVQGAGAELRFLPTYSADLNPIEKMRSKSKSLRRSAEARTLDQAISLAFSKITDQDEGWRSWLGDASVVKDDTSPHITFSAFETSPSSYRRDPV